MSIDARVPATQDQKKRVCLKGNVTPDIFLADLARGVTREEMLEKYSYIDPASGDEVPLEKWILDKIFEDPMLKGKRPAKVRLLPFNFIGSVPVATVEPATEPTVGEEISDRGPDTNQTTADELELSL